MRRGADDSRSSSGCSQPVVFGYLLAGMIIGPHIPVPLVADQAMVRTLAELGVILLMFSIGLEFSFKRLLQVGGAAGIAAITETSVMMGLGYLAGQLFGWTTLESVFLGGDRRHLQHDDHRQGVRGAGRSRARRRHRARHPHRRGPDRHPAHRDPHRGRRRARASRPREVVATTLQLGAVPGAA